MGRATAIKSFSIINCAGLAKMSHSAFPQPPFQALSSLSAAKAIVYPTTLQWPLSPQPPFQADRALSAAALISSRHHSRTDYARASPPQALSSCCPKQSSFCRRAAGAISRFSLSCDSTISSSLATRSLSAAKSASSCHLNGVSGRPRNQQPGSPLPVS